MILLRCRCHVRDWWWNRWWSLDVLVVSWFSGGSGGLGDPAKAQEQYVGLEVVVVMQLV